MMTRSVGERKPELYSCRSAVAAPSARQVNVLQETLDKLLEDGS